MSVFIGMLCDMLPMASNLQNKNNEVRKVLDYTVGEYMDNLSEINDELFLTSATGGWLDAWGKDYGVIRKTDESDDDFRERIIFEKLEYLTTHNLQNIYGVRLFCAFDGFNPVENDLTSDNPYLTDWFVGVAPEETQNILNNKFVLGTTVMWYNGEELDSIIEYSTNKKLLKNYLNVYFSPSLDGYFKQSSFKKVKLTLPEAEYCLAFLEQSEHLTDVILKMNKASNCEWLLCDCVSLVNVDLNLTSATKCQGMLAGCSSLVNIDLDLPSAIDCSQLLDSCSSLKTAVLNMSNLKTYGNIFTGCESIESIIVTIPSSEVTEFKTDILNEGFEDLTLLKINGVEVDLS